MPWVGPPPDVRRKVEAALGDGIWEELALSWSRVVALDPKLTLEAASPRGHTQWYRSPEEVIEEVRTNPRAALLTQHGLGLAVDATPSEENREAVIAEAKRQGFSVGTYTSTRGVHFAAMSNERWARSPLQSYLRALLGPLLRRE